jgi:hypothetical protein
VKLLVFFFGFIGSRVSFSLVKMKKKSTVRKSIFSEGESSTLPLDFYATKYDEIQETNLEETPTLMRKSFSFESSTEFPTSKRTNSFGSMAPISSSNFLDEKKTEDDGINPVVDPIPLLEELEIDFSLMWKNIRFVLNPLSKLNSISLNELDIAGPIVICLALGFVLLLVQFFKLTR